MIQAVMERECEVKVEEFSPAEIAKWRKQVAEQREFLFKRNWKNGKKIVDLQSKQDADSFHLVVAWYEEFGDVVGRQKERNRLDNLIDLGLDVNDPENGTPKRRVSTLT